MSAYNLKQDRPKRFARQIQAEPGWRVLTILENENGCPSEVDKAYVIGWAFEENDEFSIPYPVITTGAVIDADWLLQPDGTVEQPNGGWFPRETRIYSLESANQY